MKKVYLSPAASEVRIQPFRIICQSGSHSHTGPTATYMSNPGIGDEDDDEPAAGSRRRSVTVWDE